MAPHLNDKELDYIAQHAKDKTPNEILEKITADRKKKGILAPHITNIRKAIKGQTYMRGRSETRGRKPKSTLQEKKHSSG